MIESAGETEKEDRRLFPSGRRKGKKGGERWNE